MQSYFRYRSQDAESDENEYPIPKPITQDDRLLYVAALVVIAAGLWGVWFALENEVVAIFFFFSALIGIACSVGLRQARKPILANFFCLLGALLAILLMRMIGVELVEYVLPAWNMLMDPAVAAAAGLGLILLVLTFFLFSREALVFSIVPVLAIFGLLATLLDPRIIIGFLFFLLAAIFLLVYGHTLELKESAGLRLPHAESKRLPHNQLLISSGFFLVVLLISVILTGVLILALSRQNIESLVAALENITPAPSAADDSQTRWAFSQLNTAGSDFRVGMGPINPGQGIVMYVIAERPELWRQRVYDLYTGHGWRISEGNRSYQNRLPHGEAVLFGFNRYHGPDKPLKQTFQLASPFQDGIPAAAQPLRISFESGNAPESLIVDRFGCIVHADRPLPAGVIYTVYSAVPSPMGAPINATLPPGTRSQFLQVPFQTRRVRDLVADLVPAHEDPLTKINILRGYLASGEFTYSLQAEATPENADAVEFFLFKSKEGYCDLFASAFAIMARAAGIPSRLAVGYGEGEPTENMNEFVVKQSDAHAWVEVFLEDRGWISVDPTPPGQEEAAQEAAQDKPLPAWRVALRKIRISAIFFVLCLIVSTGLAKVLWFDPWWQQRSWEKRLSNSVEGKIMLLYARMCRLLHTRGITRQPAQTPLEYLESLTNSDKKLGEAIKPASELTRLFVNSRYGHNSSSPAHAEAAQNAWHSFKRLFRHKQPKK